MSRTVRFNRFRTSTPSSSLNAWMALMFLVFTLFTLVMMKDRIAEGAAGCFVQMTDSGVEPVQPPPETPAFRLERVPAASEPSPHSGPSPTVSPGQSSDAGTSVHGPDVP